ncbi:hypothetical protein FOMPIDRAFT_1099091, partial [Fomitopsis schrenkii]
IAEAQLTALFMQSIAYGIHMVTFTACMYTWFHRDGATSRGSVRWLWMTIAITFFVIGTLDVTLNFYHNLSAFILQDGGADPNATFSRPSSWINIIRLVLFYLSAAISDAALIYRCWIVYAHSRYQALVGTTALLLWLAGITMAIIVLYHFSTITAANSIPMIGELQPFTYAYFFVVLALNVFTTGLIIVRLREVSKRTAAFFKSTWRVTSRLDIGHVALIIIESALLYTLTVFLTAVLTFVKTNISYGLSDISLEAAGIAFDLIIIRIWMGVSTEQTYTLSEATQ